jgi:signal transduction histidine kinase/ligand-binding sensor domain-containing protein
MPRFANRRSSLGRVLTAGLFVLLQNIFSLRAAEVIQTPDYYIQSLGILDGLPHEMTHRVVQDRTGYLWISTSAGLVRFDGNHFQVFTSSLLNNQESDLLYAIARGTNGNLWAAPNCGGLVEYNERTRTFLQAAPASEFPPQPTTFLTQTRDGAFWVGYFQSVLLRWKDGQSTWFTNGLAIGETISLATDRSNQVWIASDSFLGKYQHGNLTRMFDSAGTKLRLGAARSGDIWVAGAEVLEKIVDGKLVLASTNPPWAQLGGIPSVVFEDSRGALWAGTKGNGLFRFLNGQFERLPTSHPWITDLCEDNEGNLWVTTHGGGIDRVRLKQFSVWNSRLGKPEDVFTSVCEDHQGNVWLADGADDSLIRLQPDGQKQEFQNTRLGGVRLVCVDTQNQLWMAGRFSILKWPIGGTFAPQLVAFTTNSAVHFLFSARNGDLWAGGDSGFLGRWHKDHWEQFDAVAKNYSTSVVRSTEEDQDGNMWFALNTGDLLCYRDGQFTHFSTADGLPGSTIHCILCDSTGALWMPTTRDGLWLRRNGKFYQIGLDQGFPSEVVDQMLEDNFGHIWFGTQVGLYHVDRDELLQCALGKIPQIHPIAYGRDVGLIGYPLVSGFQPTAWKSANGWLWFVTHKGVISIDPALWELNTNPPPVLVDEIRVNDKKISARDSIVLPPQARKIEFKLSVVQFSAPDQVVIRHWLEGLDSTWVDMGNQRSFIYPKLPQGKYRLRFSACNPDGVWNETAAPFSITVVPAWWQMPTVQAAGAILAAVLLTFVVRSWSHRRLRLKLERLEQKHAMEKERARLAKNLHDDLGGTLTEIGLLADLAGRNNNSPEKLKAATAFFSERVRGLARTLDTIVWTVNPTNDSLDELATYICGFSQELFALSPVRCRLDLAGEIPPIPLTPEQRANLFLTAKEAMTNVIKHSGATEAWLRIKMEGERFCICIEDNGRGFQPGAPENGKRNGLSNMRSRLQELHGDFALKSAPGQGTKVVFSLCLAAAKPAN